MKLLGIAPGLVDEAWPMAAPFLALATIQSPHLEPDDVRKAVKKGDMALWLLKDGDRFVGALAAEVVTWPRTKVARLVLAGAEDGHRDAWMQLRPELEAWARSWGCESIEAYGRPGWAKVIPGARARAVIEWEIAR